MNIINRLIPESRRWYLNSHRVSRVNKLLQICSSKQTPTLGLNKIGSTTPNTITYDKPTVSQESEHVQKSSISWLFIEKQLRIITCCLFTVWYENTTLNHRDIFCNSRFMSSFCYQCTFFPLILPHPTMNYVLMNSIEFFSFIIALIAASK